MSHVGLNIAAGVMLYGLSAGKKPTYSLYSITLAAMSPKRFSKMPTAELMQALSRYTASAPAAGWQALLSFACLADRILLDDCSA
jgi:hypothetical protein